jgi:hypothetical protein
MPRHPWPRHPAPGTAGGTICSFVMWAPAGTGDGRAAALQARWAFLAGLGLIEGQLHLAGQVISIQGARTSVDRGARVRARAFSFLLMLNHVVVGVALSRFTSHRLPATRLLELPEAVLWGQSSSWRGLRLALRGTRSPTGEWSATRLGSGPLAAGVGHRIAASRRRSGAS